MEPYAAHVSLRWSDMDAYAHINNVQFLRLLEDARVIGFRDWFGQERSLLDEGVLVSRHEIEYRHPPRAGRDPDVGLAHRRGRFRRGLRRHRS